MAYADGDFNMMVLGKYFSLHYSREEHPSFSHYCLNFKFFVRHKACQ